MARPENDGTRAARVDEVTTGGPSTAPDDSGSDETVLLRIDGPVAEVQLNRPASLNAVNTNMLREILAVGERLKAETSVRAVVLTGVGRAFCSGLDFTEFDRMLDGDPILKGRLPGRAGNLGQQAVLVWTELAVPVIAAVRGPALGAGLQIALGADIRIVTPDAMLGLLEVRWGLVPDMAGSQLLGRLVGPDVAKELVFTGATVNGTEAVRIGLATRIAEDPRAAALALAREIAERSPDAVRGAKRLLDLAGAVDLAAALAEEERIEKSLIGSPNQLEAVQARRAGRLPRFADPTEEQAAGR